MMKLEKMRNLYYVEFVEFRPTLQQKKGYVQPVIMEATTQATTRSVSPSKYIIAADNPKETRELMEKEMQKGYGEMISFNLDFKANKIGLTNKKKGVMFSWIC